MELITFANFANVDYLINLEEIHLFDRVYSDGLLLTGILNFFSNNKVTRKSFDFSSLASDVIYSPENRRIIFCGGTKAEIISFSQNLAGADEREWMFLDGYGGKNELLDLVRTFKPDVVVLSLGAGLQEEYAIKLKTNADELSVKVYTSGAFISQTAIRLHYYPPLVQMLGLRWLFRAVNNPHVRKRLIKDYPRNILALLFDRGFRIKTINIIS